MSKKSKTFLTRKVRNTEAAFIILFIIICVSLIHSYNKNRIYNELVQPEITSCDVVTKPVKINTDIVDTRLEGKDYVNYSEGYYNCNAVVKGDLIVYNFLGSKIIAKVLGTPGDSFNYERKNIVVNGYILENSKGMPYSVDSEMLQIHLEEHQIIPEGSYIILGESANGGNDSSKFGFADGAAILGKIKM